MSNSTSLVRCWDIVGSIIKSRGRTLQKYHYFEEVWGSLQNNRLIFLQAPTGAGKTEAVLTPFIQNLINGERRWHSILYVLPTKSLVFNMFHRICKTLSVCRQLFEMPKIVVDYDHGGFTPFKVFLEGDITITTYDALIYTFYGFRSYGHHLFLSVGKIAGSLVVFDEVQLLQDSQWYSPTLLPYHIANLIVFGATVIIMSATLSKIFAEEVKEALNMFEMRRNMRYPYISVEADPNRDTVMRGRLNVFVENSRLIDHVLKIAEKYERPILFIFNTVERAVEAYRQIMENGYNNVILLHSRLINDVRKNRETFFERDSVSHDLIAVATQVVEAGIDYDFRTVATEISPIDSLIQRIGRCARKSDGKALIFTDQEQAAHVYPQIIIDKTARIINEDRLAESVRNISTASSLVDAVYCKKIVEELKKDAHDELMGTLSFIKTFPTKIFISRNLIDNQASNLLRLGIEIRCILLPYEIYVEILRLVESSKNRALISLPPNQVIDLFNKNTLSLSIKKLRRDLEIPALKHKVGDEEFYLSISLASYMASSREQEIRSTYKWGSVLEIEKHNKLFTLIMGHEWKGFTNLFIVNPSFYSIEKSYHLGLVKPYG